MCLRVKFSSPHCRWMVISDSGNTSGYTTNRNADARGTLQVANDRWVCVKDGSAETWIPRDRVVMIKLSR